MMYEIDLLEGRGLPPKSQPGMIAAIVSSFLVPLFLLAAVAVGWLQNRTMLISNASACTQHEKQIQRFQDDLQQYEENKNQMSQIQNVLKQISGELYYEMQFTPILQDVVDGLPSVLTIEELELKYNPGRVRIVDKKTNQAKFVSVVNRKLQLKVVGPEDSASDQAVKKYVENLRQSSSFADRFQNIQIASRKEVSDGDQDHFVYEIECIFNEQKKP